MSLKDNKKQIVKKISDNTVACQIKKVYYHNTIARLNNKFSLEEEKALHIIFSHIKPFNFENATTVQIEKKQFFKSLGLKSKNKYPRYRKFVHNLINKSFIELKTIKGGERVGVIITGSEWNPNEPLFEIKLNDWFMPYIEQLKEHYTKVDLKTVCAFKSKHALSLYKFICSWNNDNDKINHRYQSTKELKDMFGLTINDYVVNGKFRRWEFEKKTIDIAIKEINQHSDLAVTYTKNKNGNKVDKYEFKWSKKKVQASSDKPTSKKNSKTKNTMTQEQIQQALEDFDNS